MDEKAAPLLTSPQKTFEEYLSRFFLASKAFDCSQEILESDFDFVFQTE